MQKKARIFKNVILILIITALVLEFLAVIFLLTHDVISGLFVLLLFVVLDFVAWASNGSITIYKNISIASVILIILGTIGVYIAIYLIKNGNNASLISKYQVGSASDWIGYSGSIIGGLITLMVLVFTIQNEDAKRQKDEEFRIMPIIECTSISNSKNLSEGTHIDMKFENISDFPMRSLHLLQKESILMINGKKQETAVIKFRPIDFIGGNRHKVSELFLMIYERVDPIYDVNISLKFAYFDLKLLRKYSISIEIQTVLFPLSNIYNYTLQSETDNIIETRILW